MIDAPRTFHTPALMRGRVAEDVARRGEAHAETGDDASREVMGDAAASVGASARAAASGDTEKAYGNMRCGVAAAPPTAPDQRHDDQQQAGGADGQGDDGDRCLRCGRLCVSRHRRLWLTVVVSVDAGVGERSAASNTRSRHHLRAAL
eukprot:1297163-Rhodomonas_salina.3